MVRRAFMKVYLLGSLEIEVDGHKLPIDTWKSKKALRLFKYLIAQRGKRVPKDLILDTFWPDTDESRANNSLHSTVYLLRRSLGANSKPTQDSFIRTADGLYWFSSGASCWVDSEEFARLVALGDLASLQVALTLYRGDFLAEDLYEDWAIEYREHYRELFVKASLRASDLLAKERRFKEAAETCQQALKKEPYREDLHEALISYWIKAQQYDKAIAQYRLCAKIMKEEYGLEPGQAIKRLFSVMQQVKAGVRQIAATLPEQSGSASPVAEGLFLCDKVSFHSIYELERRRQKRSGAPLTILALSVEEDLSAPVYDSICSILSGCFRRGDAACQWDSRLVAVLLLGVDAASAATLTKRLAEQLNKLLHLPVTIKSETLLGTNNSSKLLSQRQ